MPGFGGTGSQCISRGIRGPEKRDKWLCRQEALFSTDATHVFPAMRAGSLVFLEVESFLRMLHSTQDTGFLYLYSNAMSL